MFNDSATTLHLLGYLTEEQWLDAFGTAGIDKEYLKDYAKEVAKQYNMKWSEKLQKRLT